MQEKVSIAPLPNVDFKTLRQPFIIAGPCSAESESQVMETAVELSKNPHVKAFRAGIWKPRTRPNAFEGHGEKALPWMQRVKKETGLLTITEVATSSHAEAVLKAGLDMVWIGARTTVNPFSVQEIAEALKGVNIPVLIKNPVTPDLQLWIGAVERFQNLGFQNLAVIHRGFTSFEKTKFRNAPEWSIAIDFKRLMPGIPMLCDPSHMGGSRPLLLPISQKAIDLNYAGLMVETHPRPDEAWSDARQQITPAQMAEMLLSINFKREGSEKPDVVAAMEALRSKIDKIDFRILEMIAERMEVVRQIGGYKKEKGLTLLQINRWSDIFDNCRKNASNLGLTEQMVKEIYERIHLESIKIQEEIIYGSSQV